jgi:hypothetical protein
MRPPSLFVPSTEEPRHILILAIICQLLIIERGERISYYYQRDRTQGTKELKKHEN